MSLLLIVLLLVRAPQFGLAADRARAPGLGWVGGWVLPPSRLQLRRIMESVLSLTTTLSPLRAPAASRG